MVPAKSVRRLIPATAIRPFLCSPGPVPSRIFMRRWFISTCIPIGLFHGDYGSADPALNLGSGSTWVVDADSLKTLATSERQRQFSGTFSGVRLSRGAIKGSYSSWAKSDYAPPRHALRSRPHEPPPSRSLPRNQSHHDEIPPRFAGIGVPAAWRTIGCAPTARHPSR
jgi:hypothetical protein